MPGSLAMRVDWQPTVTHSEHAQTMNERLVLEKRFRSQDVGIFSALQLPNRMKPEKQLIGFACGDRVIGPPGIFCFLPKNLAADNRQVAGGGQRQDFAKTLNGCR
jgi:hypothetical protein